MTQEEAFLAAILASPQDDTPRLVYADWLDDQTEKGNDPRAEFIRVQCERARIDTEQTPTRYAEQWAIDNNLRIAAPACADFWGRVAFLRRRERELLSEFGFRWLHPFAEILSAAGTFTGNLVDVLLRHFRRGFVESVTLSAEVWLQYADALAQAAPIREVTLTTEPVLRWYNVGDSTVYYLRRPGGEWQIYDKASHPSAREITNELLRMEWPLDRITFHLPTV